MIENQTECKLSKPTNETCGFKNIAYASLPLYDKGGEGD